VRSFVKQALQLSRVKLAHERITLTKFTAFFFYLALINCAILVILQSIAFIDNQNASEIISGFLDQANVTKTHISFVSNNVLYMCKNLPSDSDADCKALLSTDSNSRRALDEYVYGGSAVFQRHHSESAQTMEDSDGEIYGVMLDSGQVLDETCLKSMIWLNELIHDAMAEDIVTLVFQIWLFLLSFVTILNESLPHLGAAIAGHVLVTAWGGYRIEETYKLHDHYEDLIVQNACRFDFLGSWWDTRTDHTIPILVFNILALVAATCLATRLYKVYARQSFNRVRASAQLNRIYKLVLVLSVCLQLGGFFIVASTAMWLDKASTGAIKHVAQHLGLYRAVFSVMVVLEIPWAILGWICIRRENRRQFLVFAGISLLLLASSSGIFASPLYQFIFQIWPFFATMTITSYLLIVLSSVLGIWRRTLFGKGLPEFLKEEECLEGADFAPVYVPQLKDRTSFDSEKGHGFDDDLIVASLPSLPAVQKPPPAQISSQPRYKSLSVYSDMNGGTLKLSSTPPLVQNGVLSALSPISETPPVLTLSTVNHDIGLVGPVTSSPPDRSSSNGLERSKIGLPNNPKPKK
jgi:hypothetical protein